MPAICPRSAAPTDAISGTTGWTPAFQHRHQHVGNCRRGTGAASSDPIEPNGQRGRHLRCWQRWPHTAAMRHDEEHLLAPDFLLGQAGVLGMTDLRRQPVYRVLAGDGAIDHLPAGRDRPAGPSDSSTCAPSPMPTSSSSANGSSLIVTLVISGQLIRDTERPGIRCISRRRPHARSGAAGT
jgi:hypothetical protein